MKSYGQFCPVAQAMEVLGERWTLLVVRELLCGSRRFNELARGVPLMSRTMLSQRLRSLEASAIVERRKGADGVTPEYHLTRAGLELRAIVEGCGLWAARWLRRDPRPDELDAGLLMWDIRRNLVRDALPRDRDVLIEFFFSDAPRGATRFWLHVKRGEVDLCLTHPGFTVDVQLDTTLLTMTRVWLGHERLEDAIRSRTVRASGNRRWIAQLPSWLALSAFAGAAVPASRGGTAGTSRNARRRVTAEA